MQGIKQRAADSGRIVDELTEQHALLKESGDALVHALDDIVNGSIMPREHVEEPARAYVADFRRHMHTEETAILPLAATLLRASDWVAIDAAIRDMDDPLFAKNGEERYAALRRQIAREAVAFQDCAQQDPGFEE